MLSVNHHRERSAVISSTTVGTNYFRVGGIRCATIMGLGKCSGNFNQWKFAEEWFCTTVGKKSFKSGPKIKLQHTGAVM